MAKRGKKVVVMGLDTAAVNSGVCIIAASYSKPPTYVKPDFLFETGIVHGPLNDHTARVKAADMIKGLCVQHNVDFVVVEGYALRVGPNNTSMAQHGETVGLVKKSLHDLRMPFMICPPTSMRSFLSVPSGKQDKGKSYIVDTMKVKYDFKSQMTNKSKISNAADAAAHAVIGSIVYMHFQGKTLDELHKSQADVLFGGRGKMKGLTNMPELYHDCSWAVFDEG